MRWVGWYGKDWIVGMHYGEYFESVCEKAQYWWMDVHSEGVKSTCVAIGLGG